MATNDISMSKQLAELKKLANSKDHISIAWRAGGDRGVIVLNGCIPRGLAMALSDYCKEQLAEEKFTPGLLKPRKCTVIVAGSSEKGYREVIKFMVSCGRGAGLPSLPCYSDADGIWQTMQLLDAAELLGVQLMIPLINLRLADLVATTWPSALAVEKILATYPQGSKNCNMVVDCVSNRLVAGKVAPDHPCLVQLRERYPGFADKLDEDVDTKEQVAAAVKEQQQADTAAKEEKRQADHAAQEQARKERQEEAAQERRAERKAWWERENARSAAVELKKEEQRKQEALNRPRPLVDTSKPASIFLRRVTVAASGKDKKTEPNAKNTIDENSVVFEFVPPSGASKKVLGNGAEVKDHGSLGKGEGADDKESSKASK